MLVYFSVPDSSHLLIDSQQKTIFAEEIFILYIAVPYHLASSHEYLHRQPMLTRHGSLKLAGIALKRPKAPKMCHK